VKEPKSTVSSADPAKVTNSDLEAGYAADGYARVKGLSAVAVSYGPGTLSIANAVAGAYIERSPIVVINGGPSDKNITDQNNAAHLTSYPILAEKRNRVLVVQRTGSGNRNDDRPQPAVRHAACSRS
jgi:hypothetical protein